MRLRHFLIRMVRDRTGVDNDYIALLTGGDTFVATLSEAAGQSGTLRKVELATERMERYLFLHLQSVVDDAK